jgi:uncharacterized protein (DUF362 family)
MGSVYEGCERQLAAWRQRYAGQPRREALRLLLLAMEREEIVSIAYREAMIVRRLQRMPLPEEVRQIIRHALVWAWKDEEMHAVYLRGALLRLGGPFLRVQTRGHQVAGAVAGWCSAVQQHVRWAEAPLARAAATAITGMGVLFGQVPRDVRRHLDYGPFRDFCLFNEDAERTAWLCYQRLVELTPELPELPPALQEDLRRVQEDEERHARLFALFAAALDAEDGLAPGTTPDDLARAVGAVGEVFLPPERRLAASAENPVGTGGRVWVRRGATAEDKLPLFRTLLAEAGLSERLAERAARLGKPLWEMRVAVKVDFMLACHRDHRAALTDPALIGELARFLREQGCRDVAVLEARNLYDCFHENRTVRAVARYFGIAAPEFRVVDASEEQVPHAYGRGMAQYTVSRTWKEADFRIIFGKMSSHPVMMVHLTLANLAGLGARIDEFLFTERQAESSTAVLMLTNDFPPHFALLDAYEAADGLMGLLGHGRPQTPRRLYAAADALALDLTAARHMGEGASRALLLLQTACHWFGDPTDRTEVVGVDEPLPGWRGPYHNEWSALLSLVAFPVFQLGSDRGALFVPEMDEEAFPRKGRPRLLFRVSHRAVQALLGLRRPR